MMEASADKPDLIQAVENHYGSDEACRVARIFNRLALRPPAYHEYSRSSHSGFLAFLDYHGAVLNISGHEPETVDHPHIIRPLGLIEEKDSALRIAIVPGVKCPISAEDNRYLKRKLRQDGIHYWDSHQHNAGYIPAIAGVTRHDFPVILDMDAFEVRTASDEAPPDEAPIIHRLTGRVLEETPLHFYDAEQNAQEAVHGPLRRLFSACLTTESGSAPGAMQPFWDACRTAHEQGRLFVNTPPGSAKEKRGYDLQPNGTPCLYRPLLVFTAPR